MSESDPTSARPSTLSDAAQIHELAEAYDAGWQPEDWARMAELIQKAPPHLTRAVAQELIVIDVQRRLARQLTLPNIRSYLDRFPDLANDPAWRDQVQATVSGPPAPADEAPPEKIGRYPVNSALAAGGEAQVFLCFHPDWRKQVVVKWMRAEAAGRADWRERFARQGELLKSLEHENIVRVYDQGECQGRPFVVTEYIQGRTLAQYARDTRPNPAQAVSIITDVAAALGHAHRSGVYHQDVKPDNILIDERGRAKLIDFGVAWFRPAWGGGSDPHGCTAGTLSYLSPEQAGDGDITSRTDVFALGGVLFFLLTARAPYSEPDVGEALKRARACTWDRTALNKPEIPARLRSVCETAMAADPRHRYGSAEEFAEAAGAAIQPPWYRSRRLLGIALLLCVFAGAVVAGSEPVADVVAPPAATTIDNANLVVQVRRPGFDPKPLSEVVPLKNGDEVQARFRVSKGVHAALVSVNGEGRLTILGSYSPRDVTYEAIWPEPGRGTQLLPPAGTEFFFVCGRTDRAPTAEELQAAWDADAGWPALEPAGRYLRVKPDEIAVEGAGSRDFGKAVEFPETDQVKRRLEKFRERMRGFAVLDGLAFRHQ